MHDVGCCQAVCQSEWRSHLQTIGKQAYEFLEAPRGKVWGAVHAVGGGSDRALPGFQSAFDAHDGRQTTEVVTTLGVTRLSRCSHTAKVLLGELPFMLLSGFHCVCRSSRT